MPGRKWNLKLQKPASPRSRLWIPGWKLNQFGIYFKTEPPEGTEGAFRRPSDSATLPELIRFIIDRTGLHSRLSKPKVRRRHPAALKT